MNTPRLPYDEMIRWITFGDLTQALTALRQHIPEGEHAMAERLEHLRDAYCRGLEYRIQGVQDANDGQILAWIKQSLLALVCDIQYHEGLKHSSWLYYALSSRRVSIAEAVTMWQSLPSGADSTAAIERLFESVWTCRHPSDEELRLLSEIDSPYVQAIVLSAMTLAIEQYPVASYISYMIWALDTHRDVNLRVRACVGLILASCQLWLPIVYDECMGDLSDAIAQRPALVAELEETLRQFIQMIGRTPESEGFALLQGGLSGLDPETLQRMQRLTTESDLSAEERERLRRSLEGTEAEEHIDRLKGMLRSGTDVFYSPFAQTKGHPFFRKMISWWLPFSEENALVARMQTRIPNLMDTYAMLSMALCDSDCYSMLLMMETMPTAGTIDIQMMSPNGAELSQQLKPTFSQRLGSYLAGMARFYRLYDRRSEHTLLNKLNTSLPLGLCPGLMHRPELQAEICELHLLHHRADLATPSAYMLYRSDSANLSYGKLYLRSLIMAEQWGKTLNVLKVLSMIDETDEDVLRMQAECYTQLGLYDQAIEALRALPSTQDEAGAETLLRIAHAHMSQMAWGQAIETTYECELRCDHRTPELLQLRAAAMLFAGRAEESLAVFGSVAPGAFAPSDYVRYGHARLLSGSWSEALKLYRTYGPKLPEETHEKLWREDRERLVSSYPTEWLDRYDAMMLLLRLSH